LGQPRKEPTTRFPKKGPQPIQFTPTWANVVKHYQFWIRTAIAPYITSPSYSQFTFAPQVTTLLQTKPYGQLTDCKAECAYQNTNYGIPGENFTTPTILGTRTGPTTCTPFTSGNPAVPASSQELTEPTSFASGNGFCSPTYESFLSALSPDCNSRVCAGGGNITQVRTCAKSFLALYTAQTDATYLAHTLATTHT